MLVIQVNQKSVIFVTIGIDIDKGFKWGYKHDAKNWFDWKKQNIIKPKFITI